MICAYGLAGTSAYCSKSCTQDADCPGTDKCQSSSKGMICRKDDVGGAGDGGTPSYDGGSAPLGDGGLDTQAPSVSITSPAQGAQVSASTTVSVQATDDQLVARVELQVDGTLVASQNASPYQFPIVLQPGSHTLTATAVDGAGNQAQASVSVTVPGGTTPGQDAGTPPLADAGAPSNPPPAGGPNSFGLSCTASGDCLSGVCASDPEIGESYCSQACGAQDWCPPGGTCVAGSDGRKLCALELSGGGQGCSLGGDRGNGAGLALALVLGLVLLGLVRRRG